MGVHPPISSTPPTTNPRVLMQYGRRGLKRLAIHTQTGAPWVLVWQESIDNDWSRPDVPGMLRVLTLPATSGGEVERWEQVGAPLYTQEQHAGNDHGALTISDAGMVYAAHECPAGPSKGRSARGGGVRWSCSVGVRLWLAGACEGNLKATWTLEPATRAASVATSRQATRPTPRPPTTCRLCVSTINSSDPRSAWRTVGQGLSRGRPQDVVMKTVGERVVVAFLDRGAGRRAFCGRVVLTALLIMLRFPLFRQSYAPTADLENLQSLRLHPVPSLFITPSVNLPCFI